MTTAQTITITMLGQRCKECDAMLYSQHAKSRGICPECEQEQYEYESSLTTNDKSDEKLIGTDWSDLELETQLERILK